MIYAATFSFHVNDPGRPIAFAAHDDGSALLQARALVAAAWPGTILRFVLGNGDQVEARNDGGRAVVHFRGREP
jgi:hypothetical protein